jgi:hypothetical protein
MGYQLKLFLPAALMAAVLLPGGMAAEPMIDRTQLDTIAKAAKTPADHAKVAKQFRLRAEEWDAKAEKHEAAVRSLQARPKSAMEHKWPAMANNKPLEKERQLAIEARRSAVELNARAEFHYRASIESQYADTPTEP